MPNTTITADKVIGKNLYAKGNVDVYDYPNGKLINRFTNGYLIGTVFSYIINNGQIYWQFYDNARKPYYVKHITGNLELRELPELIKQVEDEAIKNEIAKKGAVNYYLQKYLPYIVGAIVISFVLPAISKYKKNV
jgi:hypothetical protein